MPVIVWALLQIGLTFFGLLAGWAVQRRLGLFERGMGNALLLQKGPRAAIRGVVEGILLAIPFTIVFIAAGSTDTEGWVRSWWQPLVALQPGIAEEAWARVFLLSLLIFVTAARVASLRAAWLTSLVISVYWFASLHNFYLHVGGLSAVFSTTVAGSLMIPLPIVWWRRGLEAATGFHFLIDFGKYVAALLINGA